MTAVSTSEHASSVTGRFARSGVHSDCSAIVVTYNSAQDIGPLLDALRLLATQLILRVVVVDNGSVDGTVSIVRNCPDVELVEAQKNLGYSGGINLGRIHSGPTDTLLILNPDAVFEPSAVLRLVRACDDPKVGAAVPRLEDRCGRLYPSLRREPSLSRAFGDALLGPRFGRRPGWLSELVRGRSEYERTHDVEWATGAVLAITSGCDVQVGSWDERFFLYSEETDYFARVRQAGLRVRFVPHARVVHDGGGSGRSEQLDALMAVNRVRYYEKYHGRFASRLFRSIVVLHHMVRISRPADRRLVRLLTDRRSWPSLPSAER